VIDYYEKAIKRLGIEVRFNTEATADRIKELTPCSVVIATGSLPVTLAGIPGIDKAHVHGVIEVLENPPDITGKSVVVIGAGLTGIETGAMLFKKGNKVMVIDIVPPPPAEASLNVPFERVLAYGKAQSLGMMDFKMEHKLVEIRDSEVVVEDLKTRQVHAIPADYVVISVGVKPNDNLYQEIVGKMQGVYRIGDSCYIGKIGNAVLGGSKLAYELK
jgi:pyruvate/2-oxoglutarate dehydrogenase complex dihydrolipoamide dehydrogenase (E3) component